jgi:hypothetical protein
MFSLLVNLVHIEIVWCVYDTCELMNTLQQNLISVYLLLIKVAISQSIFHDPILSQVHKFMHMMPKVSWQVAELPWSGYDVYIFLNLEVLHASRSWGTSTCTKIEDHRWFLSCLRALDSLKYVYIFEDFNWNKQWAATTDEDLQRCLFAMRK